MTASAVPTVLPSEPAIARDRVRAEGAAGRDRDLGEAVAIRVEAARGALAMGGRRRRVDRDIVEGRGVLRLRIDADRAARERVGIDDRPAEDVTRLHRAGRGSPAVHHRDARDRPSVAMTMPRGTLASTVSTPFWHLDEGVRALPLTSKVSGGSRFCWS